SAPGSALPAELLARLSKPWAAPVAGPLVGDADMLPDGQTAAEARLARRAAAVLVPLIVHPGDVTVLLTRRTRALKRHSGQVAFPGGRVDPEDPDVVTAALREAEEEVGLPRDRSRLLGRLAPYNTATGFSVTPVVATVRAPFVPIPDPAEVAAVFEVPLAFVMDRANHQWRTRTWRGRERGFYAIPYGEHLIWGATAAMLVNLVHVLSTPGVPGAVVETPTGPAAAPVPPS
ncbi:CoA pyrophosphatase, partial [Rhodothalassium salexigens]